MKANKIILDGEVLIDLTQDTATERYVVRGKTFHKANGESSVGKAFVGVNINGMIKQSKVDSGENISAGDFVEFIEEFGSKNLDFDVDHAFYLGNYRLLSINQSTASISTIVDSEVIDTTSTGLNNIHHGILGADLASENVVFFMDGPYNESNYFLIRAIKINDNSITEYRCDTLMENREWGMERIIALDKNTALLVHTSSDALCFSTAELSNSSLSISVSESRTDYTKCYGVAALGPSKAIAFLGDDNNCNKASFLTISDNYITILSYTIPSITSIRQTFVLSESKSVVVTPTSIEVFERNSYQVNHITSTNITIPKDCELGPAYKIGENKIVILFQHKISKRLLAAVYEINKKSITVGPTATIIPAGSNIKAFSVLSENTAVLFYEDIDSGASSYNILIVDDANCTIKSDYIKLGSLVRRATSNLYVSGVAKTSGTEGESIQVYCMTEGGYPPVSEGISYTLSDDGYNYICSGIGECTDTDIIIPSEYNKLPVISIGESAFEDCDKCTSVIIGNNVETISSQAFESCVNLKNVEIPNSVVFIKEYAFCFCESLTSIEIPDSVEIIGQGSFAYCDQLVSVTIGNNVKTIGMNAFGDCPDIKRIKYNGTMLEWEAISKGTGWVSHLVIPATYVECTDGTVNI
jgi:hypothetical protein